MNRGTTPPVQLIQRRAGAYLVDIILLFAVLAPLGLLVQNLLGTQAETGPQVWWVILFNFSIPVWAYFALSDASAGGATIGKRLFRLRVTAASGGSPGLGRALLRTAVKLIPWELVHLFAFAFSPDLSQFTLMQGLGIGLANLLWMVYLIALLPNGGRRSLHDMAANTQVVAKATS
jgi:uncharacterized RDD family membrane protein YckC